LHESSPLDVTGAGNHVRISKAAANRGGMARSVMRSRAAPVDKALFGGRKQQVPALDALAWREEPVRPREPSAGRSMLATEKTSKGKPKGRASGAHRLAGGEMRLVRALEKAQKLRVSASQVRGGREQFEIVGTEGTGPIRV
jgi:hypothetical protein